MTARTASPQIKAASKTLSAGGVIAYPTEAVWGFGCDPFNRQAVSRLLALKQRPVNKGLILVASSIEQFAPFLDGLDTELLARLESSWPGPFTWLVPDNHYAPWWVRGHFQSVALRVSAHPVVAQLCRSFAGPIVSSSANRAGRPPCKWSWQVYRQWGEQLDGMVYGDLGGASKPSEIRDLVTGKVLRQA